MKGPSSLLRNPFRSRARIAPPTTAGLLPVPSARVIATLRARMSERFFAELAPALTVGKTVSAGLAEETTLVGAISVVAGAGYAF